MRTFVFNKLSVAAYGSALVIFVAAGVSFGQSPDGRSRNNPYSPSPKGKVANPASESSTVKSVGSGPKSEGSISFIMQKSTTPVESPEANRPSIAQATFKVAKAAEAKSALPTEIYKVGVGDVLFVGLRNSPQGSGYFTVRPDGSLDYPLAGENVKVVDHTVETIEEILSSSIKLFQDPQVEVKVRQYASHKIVVAGLVENGGDKYIQREAMPLFAIRAEAVVNSKATRVAIRRGETNKTESFDLSDPKAESVLIFPGDTVEFTGNTANLSANGSYFISGEIASGGQKDLIGGLTLYQAVTVAGGTKGDPKKAIIRRKSEDGLFKVQEHNLRSIKAGKSMDPMLMAGDVIEIRN
jgi:protein involved in polysaccharide export with SLBB domain